MIAPYKRTAIYAKWKETARKWGVPIRDDRPFSVYKNGKELRINTDHSVIIAYNGLGISVWNKPLQYAGKPVTISELQMMRDIMAHVWAEIEGDVE